MALPSGGREAVTSSVMYGKSAWLQSSARRELSSLAARLGLTGSAAWAPGLLAAVDQHAAAVRDILTLSGNTVGTVDLAGYARGVEDVALGSGWQATAHPAHAGWATDWVNLRLAAVCMLAGVAGFVVAAGGGDIDPLLFG